MKTLIHKIENTPACKVIFIDFFGTLVYRKVHPHYVLKLWGKFLIQEIGLSITPDELFSIRIDALSYLANEKKTSSYEVSYESLIKEVHRRLVNTNCLPNIKYSLFKKSFEQADYISETAVQFSDDDAINTLKHLREKEYRIYLVTDFFLSKSVLTRLLDFHGITNTFDAIFISCEIAKSKQRGTLYLHVLQETKSAPDQVVMIGNHKKRDVARAAKFGIKNVPTKSLVRHLRKKPNLFGHDKHDFIRICSAIEKRCRRSNYPFSEYIIHFYFFTERLYQKARRDGMQDLFFLAREGLYLKRLFDFYQELNQSTDSNPIRTHYLKASRQSAQQIALKPLEEEKFDDFGEKYGQMSVDQLLTWFLFPEDIKEQITEELKIAPEKTYENIFKSDAMEILRKHLLFRENYEANRLLQKEAFTKYLESFGTPFRETGIALVDVGWGGTMQECIYQFLQEEISVTGYYLGLKEVYNIEPNTKRYGLNFSIYPSHGASYDILKANGQLYEQLLAAGHGSTLGYSLVNGVPGTIEFHEPSEKFVFDTYIDEVQEFMLGEFEKLFFDLRPITYSRELEQEYMTNMALRVGILTNKKKITFINNLSKGFYQNVGDNKVGLDYSPSQLKSQKRTLLKKFIRSPEKVFRLLVKVKPFLHSKGLYWLSWPVSLTYYYMKFNFWVKKKWFPKKIIRS